MATKFIDLTGKAKWVKTRKPDEKYNNWTVDLCPDDRSRKIIEDSGLQLRYKKNDEGEYLTFRRPVEKLIKGKPVTFDPPKVWDASNQPYDGVIGNGSDVTIKVAVYDTVKGKGHRWEAIRVDNLVEYIPPDQAAATGAADANAPKPLPF